MSFKRRERVAMAYSDKPLKMISFTQKRSRGFGVLIAEDKSRRLDAIFCVSTTISERLPGAVGRPGYIPDDGT